MLREYLINFARSFVYTTASPFHQLAAVKMAYQLLNNVSPEITSLKNNIDLFKNQIQTNDAFPLLNSNSAIQCIVLKSNDKAREIANILQHAWLDVRAILSPTVAAGTERIRICLHAFNTTNDLTLLTDTINKFINA
jgi:8-amino-7-oxononanoate synthase